MRGVEPSPAHPRQRFLLFTGKGGVGKTTLVAAMAVHAARQGLSPLVVELGHRQSMRSIFGVDAIGAAPQDVGWGVHALSIAFEQAVLDYMREHLPSRRIAEAVVGNRVLNRLFHAMPAVGEIATLSRLRALEAQQRDGRPRWHPIFVDLDATGHALMFFELRAVLSGLMGKGPMRRLVESTAEMFTDPEVSRLDLVVTPEELPVTETIELYQRLSSHGVVAFGRTLVNRMPMLSLPDASAGLLDSLERAAAIAGEVEVMRDAVWARRALAEQAQARTQIERLAAEVALPTIELPRLPSVRMSLQDLTLLGARAMGGEP